MKPILLCLALRLLLSAAGAAPARRSLEEFGDLATPAAAEKALQAGVEALLKEGGGILEIPANAPAELVVRNTVQKRIDGPTVTFVDCRRGYIKWLLPSVGKHQLRRTGGNRGHGSGLNVGV